jgi:hypothetical protein
MKTSWMTLSFSPWSMSQTRSTSSWAVIFLIEVEGIGVCDVPLLAVLVLVVLVPMALSLVVLVGHTCEFRLGQLCSMCPWCLHLKHLPSFCNLASLSLVRAALAQVHPGVRSMALGSLAKHCCHCCQVGFLLPFKLLSKRAWTCMNLQWNLMVVSS